MLALSIAEGFARGFLSSHRATLSASRKDSANSNHSRAYATPRGRGCTGLQVRPFPQLLCFPYLRKNRGVGGMSKQSSFLPSRLFRLPQNNVGAPTFALSFLPIPTLGSLSFQFLVHSFIFRITPIPYPSSIFRTLSPKTRVYPLRSYQCFRRSPSFVKKPLLCVPSQRTLRLCGESLFSLLATRHFLPLPITNHFRGQTNVTAAGGRSVLQRCFSLRGAAASIAASNGWDWSKGREMRKRSARRAWAYFS